MEKLDSSYPKRNIFVLILFCLFTVSWWLEVGKRIVFLDKIRFEFLLAAILLFVSFSFAKNKKVGEKGDSLIFWTTLYIAVLLISLPLSADVEIAWRVFKNKILKYSLICFLITQFVVSPFSLRLYAFSTLVAFLKIGQEAIVGKITGSMVWYNQGIPRLHGSGGTMFGHPNSLSGKTVSFLPFLYYLGPLIKNKLILFLILLQVLFSVNIILNTGSRTGYLAFFSVISILIMMASKKAKLVIVSLLIFAIIFNYVPDHYKDRFMSSFSGHEVKGRSKDARITLLKDSFNVFLENPLGVGLFCFPVVQKQAGRRAQPTHNLYTQLLAETGIQGFLSFGGLLIALIKKLRLLIVEFSSCVKGYDSLLGGDLVGRGQINAQDLRDARFCLSMSRALYVALLTRLFLGCFGHDLFEIYWWIILGLAMSLTAILRTMKERLAVAGVDNLQGEKIHVN